MTSLITQGQQQLKFSLWSIALATFERAIALDETDGAAWEGKAAALKKLGRWGEAVEVEERLVEVRRGGIVLDSDFYYEQGIRFYELRRYEEAIVSYEKAIEIKPNCHEVWYNRGVVMNDLGRNEEAIVSYEKAIEFKPDFHNAWNNRGISLGELGRNEEAIVSYEKAIEIKPDNDEAWNNRGVSLSALGRKEEAIESLDKAIQLKSDYRKAWFSRGFILSELERNEEAMISYKKSIEIDPTHHFSHFNLGIVLAKAGKKIEALDSYNVAIDLQPTDHHAWVNKGFLLENMGEYQQALVFYQQAISVNPIIESFWYGHANILLKLKRYKESVVSYDKAIEIKSDKHSAWSGRGAALVRLEEYEEAIKSCYRAIKIDSKNSTGWYNRGSALSSLGRYEEAIKSYDHAIAQDPFDHQSWHDRSNTSGTSRYRSWTPGNLNPRVVQLYSQYPELLKRNYEGIVNSLEVGINYCSSSEEHTFGYGYLQRILGDTHRDYAKQQRDPQPAREKAISAYKSALQILVQDRYPEERLLTLQSIIRMYIYCRKITYVKEYQKQGIAIYEILRRSVANKRMFEAKFGTFSRTEIDILIGEDNPISALEQAEFYKNRALTWILDDWEAQSLSPTYAEMRSILTPDMAILYWHLSDDALTTFILTHDNPNPVVLEVERYNAANKLTKLIEEYKKQYQSYRELKKDETTIDRANHLWRQQLPQWIETLKGILDIAAIETHLTNIKTLILFPHRDLHLLPLHTLFPQTCTYLPSISTGITQRPPNQTPQTLLNIDDPTTSQAPLVSRIIRGGETVVFGMISLYDKPKNS